MASKMGKCLLLFLFFFCCFLGAHMSTAADEISWGQSLSGDQTIVSKGGFFELGFFTPDTARVSLSWARNFPKPMLRQNFNIVFPEDDFQKFLIKKRISGDVPPWMKKFWHSWELRTSILISLCLQIILIFSGSIRKRTTSKWITLILWSAYLLADSVAILCLSILSNTQETTTKQLNNNDLLAFWAPFLLLHLGGPDTITAFSLEDNELWLRHLLNLAVQVVLAIYAFAGSLPKTKFLFPALLMFFAGILRYGERSWALMSASTDKLRSSMVTDPDPGPNYAKFMEEFSSKKAAGLPAEIIVEPEPESVPRSLDTDEIDINTPTIISKAYEFIQTYKRLIVDLILSFHERNESQAFFLKCHPLDAFKIVEVELSFLYEILYTKSSVTHSKKGASFRVLTFSSVLVALVLFSLVNKHDYNDTDVLITYVLLGGALILEGYSIGLVVFSEWAYLRLKEMKRFRLSNMVYKVLSFFRRPDKARWSNSMVQNNLITYCIKDQPSKWNKFLDYINFKEDWDSFWYTTRVAVTNDLKDLVFREIKCKSIGAENSKGYKRFSTYRGEWALQLRGFHRELGWSIDVEFDESILLWHIATDLCYYCPPEPKEPLSDQSDQNERTEENLSTRTISKHISDYMLYLLIGQPAMLTSGIGQIRYGDTCAEAKYFFLSGMEKAKDEKGARKMLLSVETAVPPIQVKGDRSQSVLFDGCRLAKSLMALSAERRWKIMSAVWAEMLCFAACHCRGFYHARQLSVGGELLTLVWLLMAHFGIGEQYRIEAGHARAKLIVGK